MADRPTSAACADCPWRVDCRASLWNEAPGPSMWAPERDQPITMVHRCRVCATLVFSPMAADPLLGLRSQRGGAVPDACPRRPSDVRFGSAWACSTCQAEGAAPTARPALPPQDSQREPGLDW